MTSLEFTLSPEAAVRIHDALSCLAKFNENVGFEASRDKLTLNALNSSKTSSASFTLQGLTFFQSYRFTSGAKLPNGAEAPWTCSILNKALLSIFKDRAIVNSEGESSVERCEVSVQERPDRTQCRFGIKIFCRHGIVVSDQGFMFHRSLQGTGVKKIYKLTYEPVQIPRPLFDPRTCRNRWKIAAYVLKTFSEFFGPRAENLDVFHDDGRVTFTCYTEKIVYKDEVLKQPLHTAITLETADFEEFDVEDKVHAGISVKDFKAIILHAETLKASISALYSYPTRPMQLSYIENGMQCEFTLQTLGEFRGSSVAPATNATRPTLSRPPTRQSAQGLTLQETREQTVTSMPPPPQPVARSFSQMPSQRITRPSPPPPKASVNEESLFVPDDDEEERVWGARNYEEEDEGELRWESARSTTISFGKLQPTSVFMREYNTAPQSEEGRIAPTQRMSQIKGLFDD